MAKRRKITQVDDPLFHADHSRPVTRRDFIGQGFMAGTAVATAGSVFSLFANPRAAYAAVSSDLDALSSSLNNCSLGGLSGEAKVPFICFDLAGGANLAGSNVLIGQGGGQMDLLTTGGYSKLGLPGDMAPGQVEAGTLLAPDPANADFTNSQLGLRFHADSAMLRGILDTAGPALASGAIDGTVIPARSDNDTGNNPHNPMYGIAAAGAQGGVVTLIGSRSTDSGGNSMAPVGMMNPEIRPTKVDRPSDVTGMVDVGDLTAILSETDDVSAVMESIARISHKKLSLGTVDTGLGVTKDEVLKDLVRCGYIKAADIADRFAGVSVDPATDQDILDIFNVPDLNGQPLDFNDREFQKTASVMKMVIDGHAGAGTITMGGFDYHTGNRFVGENRDLRAGRCIGACLAYAAVRKQPLMIYVFSDGSLASNGSPDDSNPAGGNELGGRGKGVWTGDNSSVACSFFLVYDPNGSGSINLYNTAREAEAHRQIGMFSGGASVVTSASPAGNNVNALVNMVILNYLALHGEEGRISSLVPNHGLGSPSSYQNYISFGKITTP